MEEKINKFDPFSLIIGILAVIVSIISLRNPLPTFGAVVIIAGVVSIFIGLYKLFSVRPYVENSGWLTFNAILDIIIGAIMLFNGAFGSLYVAIFFAVMFIMDSFTALWASRLLKPINNGLYWLEIIVAILGVIFGFVLLFSPMLSAVSISFMVALLFMTFGIEMIVHSF
ncbi:HdeD family acid-resistance protein [Lentilactobacillus kribbianus]|uniref:HdeD family acid-resistance protein n=1 Tax=Lentilactobacillus kribbianus TaxID=2729622 RepID=UPI0015539EF0|nr:DUF308 domain-containing protein [Lentilactobacillus kribbianus]